MALFFCFQRAHDLLDSPLQLRVSSLDHLIRPIADVDIGKNAGVFDDAFAPVILLPFRRINDDTAIDQSESTGGSQIAGGSLANQQPAIRQAKGGGKHFPARFGPFIGDA